MLVFLSFSVCTPYPNIAFNFTDCCERPIATIEHNVINWQIVEPGPAYSVWRIYMFCTQKQH